MSIKKFALSGALAVALSLGLFAPSYGFLDKTRFVAHLGVAYFCFHHWVMKPYQQGAFQEGAAHRTAAIVKGGVALLFAVHEVKVADKIAKNSQDPLLKKIDGGVAAMETSFATIGQRFKSGQFSKDDVNSLSTQTSAVSSQAAAGGATIKDVPIAVPGG